MTNNVLDYLKADATIQFDASSMKFVGEVETKAGPIYFSADDMDGIYHEYDMAAKKAMELDEVYHVVANEVVSVSQAVASGDAKLKVSLSEPDERLGMMIKIMLAMADGATFTVQEKRAS